MLQLLVLPVQWLPELPALPVNLVKRLEQVLPGQLVLRSLDLLVLQPPVLPVMRLQAQPVLRSPGLLGPLQPALLVRL